jgi:selenoprotein W-related protein
VSLAEALLDEFSQDIQELKLIPSYGGIFEVMVDGQLIFSKKQTHRHPTIDEIRKVLRQRTAA